MSGSLMALDEPKADLSTAVIWHDGTNPMWFGDFPADLYDGDTSSLSLANYADEPVNFTFLFPESITAKGARVYFTAAWGDPAYTWSFTCADNVADLNSQTGSFHLLASNVETPSDVWSEKSFQTVTCSAFRLNGYRLTGDHFLHINEIEIMLDSSGSQTAWKLNKPAGLAEDVEGGLVIADAGHNALVLLNGSGIFTETLGEGMLSGPMDVALDTEQRYVVADTGNNRVVRLASGGFLESILADEGSAPGQVLAPEGVSIDPDGNILIADTGHHRIIRLNSQGLLDVNFGAGGVVGGPDPATDDSGFNSPSGVSWDPYQNQVLVSDTGNNRIQVLDSNGSYIRTIDAVYRPHAAASGSDGTVYAVGDGGYFPPVSGSVRIISPASDFVSEHFFNGDVGVAQLTGGVLLSAGGDIIVTETSNGGLLRIPDNLQADIEGISFDVGSDQLTVRYHTRIAVPTVLLWGESELSSEVKDTTPAFEHEITATGLSPDTNYLFTVNYPRSRDDRLVFMPPFQFRTEPANTNMLNVMRLRTVGIVYTHGLSPEQVQQARKRFEIVEDFFFQNSRGRLHLDTEIVEVEREYTGEDIEGWGGFKISSAEADLQAAGYVAADQIDELIVFFGGIPNLPGGNYGGGGTLFDRFVGYCSYVTDWPFVAIHEVSHTLDTIYANSGFEEFEFNHGLWAVRSVSGGDLIVNGEIVRKIPDSTFSTLAPPFERIIEAADPDHDGLVEGPLFPVSESSTNANPDREDSDFDGVSDLFETQAGTMHGTNPNVVDSDGDGATQGADMVDRNPMFPIEGYVTRATPQVDGVIGETEGWTLVSDQVNFHNPFLFTTVVDTDQHQDTRVWVAWDSTALYLAMEFSTANVQFNIDGNGNGWFAGYDNYRLEFNTDSLYWVAVAAADKDLMFSIDSSGGWSEIFDNSDKWLSQPPDGLGLDRLIDPDDVEFARTSGSEGNTFVEIRIPSNPRGAFEPAPGQEVKLYVRLDGDVLWDEDMFVRILLVDPVDTDGDGLWDLQESDLGSHPGLVDGDSDGLADVEELARGFDPLKADTDGDGLKDVIDPLPLDPRYNLDSPTGINASDGTYMDKVRVTWNDVAGEDSYTVYRCSTTNIDSCRQLATTAAGMTIYDDIGANADGTVHYYRVCACSIEDGCSGISDANSGNRFTDLIFRNGFESD